MRATGMRIHAAGAAAFLLAAAFALAATSLSAAAQVIVVKSTEPALKPGAMLPNSAAIRISKGKQAVFVLPSGATRTVSGPFKGKAANLTKGVRANRDLLAAVQRYVVTGGANERNVGAMRSAVPRSAISRGAPVTRNSSSGYRATRPALPFSWHSVPVTASGDYCLEKGHSVSIARPYASGELSVTIIDLKSKQRTRVTFPKGKSSVAWPEAVDLTPGATYAILMDGRPVRELRLRLITPLPASENTLQVLHGQRCENQFQAYIRQLQASAR